MINTGRVLDGFEDQPYKLAHQVQFLGVLFVNHAMMAELGDAIDLGSIEETRGGSTPSHRIFNF